MSCMGNIARVKGREIFLRPFPFPCGLREAGRKRRRLEKMIIGSLAILLDVSTVGV